MSSNTPLKKRPFISVLAAVAAFAAIGYASGVGNNKKVSYDGWHAFVNTQKSRRVVGLRPHNESILTLFSPFVTWIHHCLFPVVSTDHELQRSEGTRKGPRSPAIRCQLGSRLRCCERLVHYLRCRWWCGKRFFTGVANDNDTAGSDSSASGTVTGSGGSSSFVDTVYGEAKGSSGAGVTASSVGVASAAAPTTFVGTSDANSKFLGAAASTGDGSFEGNFNPDLTSTSVGVAKASGNLNIVGNGSGSAKLAVTNDDLDLLIGSSASSIGAATNTGGGEVAVTNSLGSAGGLASGASSSGAAGGGSVNLDTDDDATSAFSGTGISVANFDSVGKGIISSDGGLVAGTSNGAIAVRGAGTGDQSKGDILIIQSFGSGTGSSGSGSSGFASTPLGGATGSSTGGATGSSVGSGSISRDDDGEPVGEFKFSGATDATGSGAFGAAVSPTLAGASGGSGEGAGSLNVVNTASGINDDDTTSTRALAWPRTLEVAKPLLSIFTARLAEPALELERVMLLAEETCFLLARSVVQVPRPASSAMVDLVFLVVQQCLLSFPKCV